MKQEFPGYEASDNSGTAGRYQTASLSVLSVAISAEPFIESTLYVSLSV